MDTLAAAHEVNGLWHECLDDAGVKVIPETCPGDRRVAQVIEKHFRAEEHEEEQQQQKQK